MLEAMPHSSARYPLSEAAELCGEVCVSYLIKVLGNDQAELNTKTVVLEPRVLLVLRRLSKGFPRRVPVRCIGPLTRFPVENGRSTVEFASELLAHRKPLVEHAQNQLANCFPRNDGKMLDFLFGSGDDAGAENPEGDAKRLARNFFDALTIPEDEIWVDLSPHSDNRPVPEVLDGTVTGRDLLDQDCILKRLVASLLHPDHELGARYWADVYDRIAGSGLACPDGVSTFIKTWVVPSKIQIFDGEVTPKEPHLFQIVGHQNKEQSALLPECIMEARCEVDRIGIQAAIDSGDMDDGAYAVNEIEMDVYKSVLLPAINRQVNYCALFAPFRQIMHAIALASWYKNTHGDSPLHDTYMDSRAPHDLHGTVLAIDGEPVEQPKPRAERVRVDAGTNEAYHAKYMDLFSKGLYRCLRKESLPGGGVITRMYSSGAIMVRGSRQIAAFGIRSKPHTPVNLCTSSASIYMPDK